MDISDIKIGDRLDRFLTNYLAKYSRSAVQKLIAQGLVTVNNKTTSKHYVLKEGDVINVQTDDLPVEEKFIVKGDKSIKLDIVEETEDYLVLNKPAGLITHPGSTHLINDTLINGVIDYCPAIVEIGEDDMRPGIVHRLDRDVSGLIVIAKTEAMFVHLKQQFKERSVEKKYQALVHGVMSKPNDEINFSITRSSRNRTKMSARPDQSGKTALTKYSVLKQYQNYALLDISIETGRTHQIRVHLSAINHPIVGDEVYKPKSLKTRKQLNRIFLHANKLSFLDLNNSQKSYQLDLPSDLNTILNSLF